MIRRWLHERVRQALPTEVQDEYDEAVNVKHANLAAAEAMQEAIDALK